MNARRLFFAAWAAFATPTALPGCRPPTTSEPAPVPAETSRGPAQANTTPPPTKIHRTTPPPRRTMTANPFCMIREGTTIVCPGGSPRSLLATYRLPKSAKGQQIVDIDARGRRVCGITEPDRRLRCWRGAINGEREPDLVDLVDLAMGELHTCVLGGDGAVRCWGNNDRGQIGDGSRTYRARPTLVHLPAATAIEAGPDSTCALLKSGGVSCWGSNTVPGDTRRLRPSRVAQLKGVKQLLGPTRAVRADGSVVEWSPVDHLAVDFTAPRIVAHKRRGDPVGSDAAAHAIPPELGNIVELREMTAGSQQRWCARNQEGHVWCWGHTSDFLRFDASTTEPRLVLGISHISAMSLAFNHACALGDDGSVWCWGSTARPQAELPVKIALPSPATRLIPRKHTTCAHTRDGIYCWDTLGATRRSFDPAARVLASPQAATICEVNRAELRCRLPKWLPSEAADLVLPTAAVVVLFADEVCRGTSIRLQCHGFPSRPGRVSSTRPPPRTLNVDLTGLTDLDSGGFGVCGRSADGGVTCVGTGELNRTASDRAYQLRLIPQQMRTGPRGLGDVVKVGVGDAHACALHGSGHVTCWGTPGDPALGHDSGEQGRVRGIEDAIDLTVGAHANCVVRADGLVYCWGAAARWLFGREPGGNSPTLAPLRAVPGWD